MGAGGEEVRCDDRLKTMPASPLPFLEGLSLPVIAAPMLRVSGIELVSAACRAGIVGAFPTLNTTGIDELKAWLQRLDREAQDAREAGRSFGPYCPNLIMRRDPAHVREAAELFARSGTRMVITSVGSPEPVMPILRDGGVKVLCDVATMRHAEKALELGVDGLVLLTAGAGGTTGAANPFAFVRAIRSFYDGPVVLSGGVSDGIALRAALELGCTLVNMGTRFIATAESMATTAYRQMVVAAGMDDIVMSKAVTGLNVNWLRPSLVAAGLDPDRLDESVDAEEARRLHGRGNARGAPERWSAIWSAGHCVTGVQEIATVAEVVLQLKSEFNGVRGRSRVASGSLPNTYP